MLKIYEAVGQNSARLCTTWCGTLLELNFINGNRLLGRNAELATSNRFVQDAIEHDRRFGTAIRLRRSFAEAGDAADAAPGDAKAPAGRRTRKSVDAAEAVESVRNANDAISYFLGRGEPADSGADIEGLKRKYNVTFPNMK